MTAITTPKASAAGEWECSGYSRFGGATSSCTSTTTRADTTTTTYNPPKKSTGLSTPVELCVSFAG
jgi:hypothetical protein